MANILYLRLQLFPILQQKEFLKDIKSKKSNGSHTEVLQKHHIFIHSLMSENNESAPLIVCDFRTK